MKEYINQTDSTSLFVSNLWPITSSCEGKEKDVLQEIIRCVIMKMEKCTPQKKRYKYCEYTHMFSFFCEMGECNDSIRGLD